MVPLSSSELLRKESHEVYRPAGDILVIRRGQFYRDTDQDTKMGHLEVDERAAHHINSDWTWEIAETYAARSGKRNGIIPAESGRSRCRCQDRMHDC